MHHGDSTQQVFWVYGETDADAANDRGPDDLQTNPLYKQVVQTNMRHIRETLGLAPSSLPPPVRLLAACSPNVYRTLPASLAAAEQKQAVP